MSKQLTKTDLLSLLEEHGAIVAGHFQLASGLHTPIFLDTALILQYPNLAGRIARSIAAKLPQAVDVVISSSGGPLVLGQELARLKRCRAIFAERRAGVMGFRRDFRLARGERALIAEDVLTTGRQTAEIVALAEAYGARILGVGAIVDRSTRSLGLRVPLRTLVSYPLQVSPPQSCAQCMAQIPVIDVLNRQPPGNESGEGS